MSKLKVHVEGYGSFKVKRPSSYTKEAFDDAVADAVAKTMNLITKSPDGKFHPALGRLKRE